MKFTNINKIATGMSFTAKVSDQEAEYLINFAIDKLLQEGILSLQVDNEEQDIPLPTGTTCH